MHFLKRLRAIILMVVKRVTAQPGLMLATTVGLVIAIALMMSIPLYADAVYHRIFLQNVGSEAEASDSDSTFGYLFRYDGSIYGTKDWSEVRPLDAYLTEKGGSLLGIPQKFKVRYFTTDPFGLYAGEASGFDNRTTPLVWAGFAFISDFQDHVTVLEGRFPAPAPTADGSSVEVLIHDDVATELGAQVGESYIAFMKIRSSEGFVRDIQIPVRISGVWEATDEQDPFWFFRPAAFTERLMVPEGTFSGYINEALEHEVYTAVWYLAMEGQEVHHSDANNLIRRTLSVQQKVSGLLPDATLGDSPIKALIEYRRSANLLTILLYAFSIPILGLLLAFILLTSGLSVDRRRNEVAVLRSRGAMAAQMVGIAVLESLLLGGVALAFSSPVGMGIARLIGQARSFLDFTANVERLRINMTMNTLRFGMLGVGIAMVAQILPTFGASKHTIVSYKRERARMLRKPWWQRVWLDVLLLIPAGYGAYLLREQGSVVQLETQFGSAPFQNPLLFLVPALGILALTLLFLRVMPLLMNALAWIASQTKAVGLLMAVRHLARTPQFYNTPLILLVLTLSLSAFTASLAQTLDDHLFAQTYYNAGADVRFLEMGEGAQQGIGDMFSQAGEGEETAVEEDLGPRWFFLPVTEYLGVPGVEKVARVGRYTAVANVGAGRLSSVYMGVDRLDFQRVGYWREDFSSRSLGELMNALALERRGVLVSESFLRENILSIGDEIRVDVTSYGDRAELDLKIVGKFRYFPTWYPSEGPLFVGNLEYFFEQAGGQYPYQVWLDTEADADIEAMAAGGLGIKSYNWEAPPLEISEIQKLPERQGLFGLLSVGFASAALLTVMGFFLYALFSFQRRFIEFGVLRAVGLSSRQMSAFLGWELAFLILMGGALGTALGGWVSKFFIPFLQIGADEASRIPPYQVDIAWSAVFRIYLLFGLLFIVALVALIAMLRRMRIFEAVKLGQTE
jgi:putative ABC transport system permease protein